MKKILKGIACSVFLLSAAFSVTANADYDSKPITVSVNDKTLEFDVAPVIEDGRTLIPIRAVSEQLEYDVVWDSENSRVEIKNNDDTLELFIGKQQYLKNGIEKQLDVPPKATDGRTLVPLRLVTEEFGCTVRWLQESYKAEIVKYETVKVSNAREFLEAIGSYKRIVLSEGEYNLSEVEEGVESDFVSEAEWGDGIGYTVFGAKDLIIEGEEGKNVSILIEPRYTYVLSFGYGEHIALKNLTMGHTTTPGYCTGGVVLWEGCEYVDVENLHLFGCGTYGITTENCTYVNVKDTEIYECTYGLIEIMHSNNVAFDNCIFRDTGKYDMFYFEQSSNVKVSNSMIKNNKSGVYSKFIGSYDSADICFENCDFNENAYFEFTTEGVIFENCKNNGYIIE